MGKKFWGETLRTTGVKLPSESEVPGWHSAECRVLLGHIVPDGSKSEILTSRKYFASDLYANDLPPGFFRSHAGQKDRFVIFDREAPKTSKKFWGETLRTTGVKFRSEVLSPGQNSRIWPMWSHHCLNIRIEIFCSGAAKTEKKFWGETLRTTGVKFRSEILSPG